MQEFLSKGEIADKYGLSLNTVKSYDREGRMPKPDARIGRNYGWLPETIEKWMNERPGAGARTDLKR